MIATVPGPSAVANTIPARQTCILGAVAVRHDGFEAITFSGGYFDDDPGEHRIDSARPEPPANPLPDSTVAFNPPARHDDHSTTLVTILLTTPGAYLSWLSNHLRSGSGRRSPLNFRTRSGRHLPKCSSSAT